MYNAVILGKRFEQNNMFKCNKENISVYVCVFIYRRKFGKLNFRQYEQMEKHSQEEVEPERNSDKEKVRREKIRDGQVRREKMQLREKIGKSRNNVFFL